MNRTCLFALIACAGLDAGLVQAADLDPIYEAPTPAARAHNWTGFYAGVHAGYGFGNSDWRTTLDNPIDGAIGGVQAGYNQQFGNFVFGIEGDISVSGIDGTRSLNVLNQANLSQTTKINWLSTVTGRFGFANGAWLTYAKGGVAWANEDHSYDVAVSAPPQTLALSGSETRKGWVVGAGVEYALASQWSARAEYNYINFANHIFNVDGVDSINGQFQSTGETKQNLHLVKLGVNYHFGAPAEATTVTPALYVASGFDWTGLYVGLQAGYAVSKTQLIDFEPEALTASGGLAGGQIGANVQLGAVVFGVEAELVGGSVNGDKIVVSGPASVDLSTRTDWLAMATARVGMVTNERWLTYVKAGVAVAHDQHALTLAQGPMSAAVDGTRLHTGLVLGAGIEYAFARNWSAKLEYDYIDFGQENATLTGSINAPPQVGPYYMLGSVEKTMQIGKIGVNYHLTP